jgi:hypothetical protein
MSPMSRILHVHVKSGLCNRLRALLSSVSAAKAMQRDLRVSWRPAPQCGASLNDLWLHPFRETNRLQRRLWGIADPHDSRYAQDVLGGETGRIVHVRTGNAVTAGSNTLPWPDNLGLMTLRPGLRHRVDVVDTLLGDAPRVGIQVRAHPTSHPETLAASPLAWYLRELEPILRAVPNTRVFGSFDLPEVEEQARAALGDVLLTLAGKGEFNTVHGVQDALCDLYLLAGCDFILGAYLSSMGSTAGFLQQPTAYANAKQHYGLSWQDALPTASQEH